mmetsp:Transcript_15268/g.38551  ORF Transcript_15268/g.38551 Transcript_15268/m.38551 type:complete len:518 (-) Transcript_15268:952-2505(-)
MCDEGYCGDNCSQLFDRCGICDGAGSACCSGHGEVDGLGHCLCDEGYCSQNCSLLIDQCGVCGGNSMACHACSAGYCGPLCTQSHDACGICEGDNSTCVGCDGIPFSGKVVDLCGVCGGNSRSCCSLNGTAVVDNATIICACDNETCGDRCQYFVDECGECNGNGRTCCSSNGVAIAVPDHYHDIHHEQHDCLCDLGFCGVYCSATIDVCGVCNGTDRSCCSDGGVYLSTQKRCLCDTGRCGVTCEQNIDNCGVCGGNNRECCDHHGAYNGSVCACDEGWCGSSCDGNFDGCAVCNGNGSSCCSWRGVFDKRTSACRCMSGYCGNECNAKVDLCNVCNGDSRSCCSDMGVRTMIQLNSTTLTPQYAFRCVCDNGYCGGSCDQVCGNAFHRGEGEEQEAHSLEEASSSSNGGNNTLPDNTITIVLALVGCVVAGAIIAVVSACFVRKRKVQKARSYRRQRDIRGRHSVESIGYGENTFGDSEVLSPAEVVPVTPVQLQALRHDRGIPIVKGEAVPPPK